MKVYFENDRLVLDDGADNQEQHTPSKGVLLWGKDDELNDLVTIKSEMGVLIERELFSSITDKLDVAYVDRAAFETMLQDFFVNALFQNGDGILSTPETVDLDVVDQWYDITGIWEGFPKMKGFEYDDINDELVFVGYSGTEGLFIGSSDLQTAKNTRITYGLFKNGDVDPVVETPHDFQTANAIEHIGALGPIALTKGDRYKVKAKSGVSLNSITPISLTIAIWCDR